MNLVADLALAAVAILLLLSFLWIVRFWVKHAKDDPTVWEREIRRLEKFDRLSPPRPGAIHFVGSSSFRYWKSLAADMAPLSVLNRGFGGSQIHDVIYYLPRIVVPFRPRAIVFYAGENDIAGVLWSKPKSPEDVRLAFEKFCGVTRALLPDVPIYFISIKPPKARRKHWPTMREANRLVRDYAAPIPAFITSMSFRTCWMMRVSRGSMSFAGMACTTTKRAMRSGLRSSSRSLRRLRHQPGDHQLPAWLPSLGRGRALPLRSYGETRAPATDSMKLTV